MDKRAQFQKSISGDMSTSRQNLDKVLENLELLRLREKEADSTDKEISKSIGMSKHTFIDKVEKALDLIRSKKIVRFFPRF